MQETAGRGRAAARACGGASVLSTLRLGRAICSRRPLPSVLALPPARTGAAPCTLERVERALVADLALLHRMPMVQNLTCTSRHGHQTYSSPAIPPPSISTSYCFPS
jgi:hypothetical protein